MTLISLTTAGIAGRGGEMKIKNEVLANSCAAVLIAMLFCGLCNITLGLKWEEGSDSMPGSLGSGRNRQVLDGYRRVLA